MTTQLQINAWRQSQRDRYFERKSNAKRRCDPCGVETKANNPRCGNCTKRAKVEASKPKQESV